MIKEEEDRQNLEQLLPKIEAQNHEEVVKYIIIYNCVISSHVPDLHPKLITA